jgi:demethylmenaquinone methyltransferase/2-methoxy-6-polyprenyl-1,4-benzoquinol methylase
MAENIYNPEYVKGLFNRMSSSYERVNFITSFGFSIRWRRQFLHRLQPTAEKIQVIDLMTGMGETWNAVHHRFPNASLSALDFSKEMLKNAQRKNELHFNGKVQLLQQDILQNGLPDNYYDIVICAFGLKTFNEAQLETLAEETKRILKPGGQFSFVEVSRPSNGILKALYEFYLAHSIPVLGQLLLGNPTEYRMLWRYTQQFRSAEKAMEIFNAEGLHASFISYFFGCATGFSGYK